MLGVGVTEILMMLARTKITQSTTSMLAVNKDPELRKKGGLFLFGFRLWDIDEGEVYDDPSVIQAFFTTDENLYDYETQSMKTSTTTYFSNDCKSVIE